MGLLIFFLAFNLEAASMICPPQRAVQVQIFANPEERAGRDVAAERMGRGDCRGSAMGQCRLAEMLAV
jgi:hypothetical protein